MELFSDVPASSKNFIAYCTGEYLNSKDKKPVKEKPKYKGYIFHRIIPGFKRQGGEFIFLMKMEQAVIQFIAPS